MSKDAYYFSHDSNARNDVRMIKLRRMGNLEAIGLYWCVVEILREADKYELPLAAIDDICYELRVDRKIFDFLFECGLLIERKKVFFSKSLKNRMLRLDEIKQKRKVAGAKGGKSKAIGKQLPSNKSIVNDSKEEESKSSIEDKTLMRDSGVTDLMIAIDFKKKENEDLKIANHVYYHKALFDWSESKGIELGDWIAQARVFARRDLKEGKLVVLKNVYIK